MRLEILRRIESHSKPKSRPGPPQRKFEKVPKLPDPMIVDPYLTRYLDLDYQLDFDSVIAEPNITDNCAICLESLDKKLSTLDCGHVYHSKCVQDWLHQTRVIFCLIKFYRLVSANVPFVPKLSPLKLRIYILTWTCLASQGKLMI